MKKEIIIFALLLIVFLIFITREPPEPKEFVNDKVILNYSNLFFNYKIIRYPTSVEVLPLEKNINIGMVTDPWNLKFGSVPGNGSSIKRYISITNLKEKYNKIKLRTYGNITPIVNFTEKDFILNQNESAAIEVNLYTDSVEYGNYSGEIDVIIKIPNYDFLKILLWLNEKIVFINYFFYFNPN